MKNEIKSLILFAGYILHHNHNSKVIYYHDISKTYTSMGTPLELFKKHIDCVQGNGFKIIPTITENKGQIQICFDDGWKGIYEVRNFFIENNIRPTIFLAVNLVGADGHLTWNEILELQKQGFIFESHTMSHKELTLFDVKELKWELAESKKILEEKLQKTVTAICFPCGCFSNTIIEECEHAGYVTLYSSVPGSCDKEIKGLIRRNLVQSVTEKELLWIIKGDSLLMRYKARRDHFKNE